jgi:hypothetical protein
MSQPATDLPVNPPYQTVHDVIVELTCARCWEEYKQHQRLPDVRFILQEILATAHLQPESPEFLELLVFNAAQAFQNILLRNRRASP